jgi:serine palmitoyltransferase
MSQNITVQEILTTSGAIFQRYLHHSLQFVESIPGGPIIVRYIKSSHKNDPIRTLLELALLVFAIRYITTSRSSLKKKDFVKLSKQEVDDLVEDWEPEGLVIPVSTEEQWQLDSIPINDDAILAHVKLEGHDGKLINAASLNFLDLGADGHIREEVKHVIKNTGVGACGPPNFYGNQDIHIKLETDLAEFFGAEGTVLYGQDFTTAGSVLPSFLKRGDYVLVDANCNLAIQKALQLSRSNVYWFKHNDMEDLERIMSELHEQHFKFEKPISRKFIVTEGLFTNVGDFPDLKKIIQLKEQFKFRVFLDESLSFGVMGPTGRGLAEHYGIPRSKIDISIGSMANAFNSSGAFCIGDHTMTYHQRIGSLAYCFSASLPPYTARATSLALQTIDESISKGKSTIIDQLQDYSKQLYDLFNRDRSLKSLIKLTSVPESSILHLQLHPDLRTLLGLPLSYTGSGSEMELRNKKGNSDKFIESLNNEQILLQLVVNQCMKRGIAIMRPAYSWSQEIAPLIPHLRISVNNGLSKVEVKNIHTVVSDSLKTVVKGITQEEFEALEL